MASSSYHYSRYRYYKREVNKFNSWLEQLREIRSGFSSRAVTGAISDVNTQIKACRNYKDQALNGDSTFDRNLVLLDNAKEKSVEADGHLSTARHAINMEIDRITGKRDYAASQRDRHWRLYLEALAREAATAGV